MDKRYQVFVSSTYTDLIPERSLVTQTLMTLDCIPAGMELFPASGEDQWEFIKKIIDDCDYYILIIGGRYGTITTEGISYTEKEYDYAVSIGIQVLAFLYEDVSLLPNSKKETDSEKQNLLEEFKKKVKSGRLVKFWTKPEELQAFVALSLPKEIKAYPAIGWVRANKVSTEESLTELNELRKENDNLKSQIANYEAVKITQITNLASIDENVNLTGKVYSKRIQSDQKVEKTLTWKEIFRILSPFLLNSPNESIVKSTLGTEIFNGRINDQDFQTIKIQLMALNLVDIKYLATTQGGMAWFWGLTSSGKNLMYELRTIKTTIK